MQPGPLRGPIPRRRLTVTVFANRIVIVCADDRRSPVPVVKPIGSATAANRRVLNSRIAPW